MTTPLVVERPLHPSPSRGVQWVRRLGILVIAVAVLLVGYLFIGWPWLSRWGATAEEAAMPLPGDELVADAPLQTTRAITIRATGDEIYPWLVQMGVGRAGLYSYEWLENLIGLKVENADRVHPEWQDTQPGDFMRYTPLDYPIAPGPGMWVEAMEPGRALVTCNGLEDGRPETCTSSITYVLQQQADGTTRLIVRDRFVGGGPAKLWQAIPFIMERGQLLGLRHVIENTLGR